MLGLHALHRLADFHWLICNRQAKATVTTKFGPRGLHRCDIPALLSRGLTCGWTRRSQGVVHRDVKPENVLVSADGVAKLSDLGMAMRLTDPDHADEDDGGGRVHP